MGEEEQTICFSSVKLDYAVYSQISSRTNDWKWYVKGAFLRLLTFSVEYRRFQEKTMKFSNPKNYQICFQPRPHILTPSKANGA